MNENITMEPLNNDFFQQSTLDLSRSLLGCLLVKETEEGLTAGYIVETEAYIGPNDRAAHSFGNRRTKRTEIMFGEAGLVYTYTMHTHCLINVVSAGVDEPEAVLIRALEPVKGIDLMKRRRPVDQIKNLTNGPGKLTKAMGITMEDYGRKFFERPLFISKGYSPDEIEQGTRIGIQNTGEARFYPWRFWVKGNQYVSK
ncbi:MAG TPA: DNA-3-methyladenine glycosylase [Bacillus bacterium]|uniref:Putative 3-methyladenine DNA glycosylase n=1 Tax=Siminovitchia fordii TaxID=254759 RepID=A0ABQ4K7M0_9BACI|nr:DNA-3-methyladenine glycosylase [Siminovitchia fordii]GIN20833.1 putative 3-methyladenine DNA glycosylase [Siminovitchia fordii]HBZ11163.1 DNA-3-methyladenine glycosylase [Bacillus sp. (in: firmicutes)]